VGAASSRRAVVLLTVELLAGDQAVALQALPCHASASLSWLSISRG
jgi:hypothetical protein